MVHVPAVRPFESLRQDLGRVLDEVSRLLRPTYEEAIDVDPDGIAADLRDGVLTVRLAQLARPVRSPSRPQAGGGGGGGG